MKKILRSSLIAMIVACLFASSALAGSTTKTLSTNFSLVNFGASEASVQVSYLKSDGSVWTADPANTSFTIPANGGQVQIRQYFDTTLTAGQGSAVISSTQELGAVVQVLARNQNPSSGAYKGYQSGSDTWYVPLVAHQGVTASGTANSQIVIQNVSSGAVDASIQLIGNGSLPGYTKNISQLGSGVSFSYDLADETNLPVNWFGSAVVTSATVGSLAVVSNNFFGPDALLTVNGFPKEQLATTFNIASFMSKLSNGLNTVITVQNLSGATILASQMTLTCVKDPSSTGVASFVITNPDNILDKASFSFNSFTGGVAYPSNWYGSCSVSSPGNIVAFAQLRYIGVATNGGSAAYEGIPAGSLNTKVVVPLIAKRLPNGFASVVTIQNQTANVATVSLQYTPANECSLSICDLNLDGVLNDLDKITVSGLTIIENGSIMRNHRLPSGATNSESGMPDGWVGSLVVTSNQPINGFVQLTNYSNQMYDTFMAHGVFSQP